MDKKLRKNIIRFQVDEISAFEIYKRLAKLEKNKVNKGILNEIADSELKHYELFRQYSQQSVGANKLKILFYFFCARIFGLIFAFKLMESSERLSAKAYHSFDHIPELLAMAEEEEEHENKLIGMITEEHLSYMGSVVLGLNDALVEFTGALAGYTLALNDTKLIALTGSITGIAAALSMGSSEYMSTKSEDNEGKHPVKAAIYTTIAYLITVTALVLPFVLMTSALGALVVMLAVALSVIALFNFYYSVVRGETFRKRFSEMAILSFTVAGVSFLIGYLLRLFTGIEI